MTTSTRNWQLHGYAIVSSDDCIADASGSMPASLQNEADWAYFQAELDRSCAVLLGRAAHEATPNTTGRLRIVMSRSLSGLKRIQADWWWNPDGLALVEMLAQVVPGGGQIGVPGGRGPFDYLLATGQFDAFHLSRANRVSLPGGVPLFSGCERGQSASEILTRAGLQAGSSRVLDMEADVTLTIWQRTVNPSE